MAAMEGFGDTLKSKWLGVPVYVWALLGTLVLAWYLRRKKAASSSASNTNSSSDLSSAQELANEFTTAGLMPYQGGNTFVNVAGESGDDNKPPYNVPGNYKPPTAGHDIRVSKFVPVNAGTSWDQIAKQYHVFGGNGQALLQYNLLKNKHSPAVLKLLSGSPTALRQKESIAIPTGGTWITLPYVGTVKS